MALANGLLVHGPSHWAAAIRRADGTVGVASGPKPRLRGRGPAARFPGLRGLVGLAESVAVIPLARRALPEARLPFESARVLTTAAATAAVGALLRRRGKETAVLALSVAPSLVALSSGDVAGYHGAEHKTIGAYETGEDDHTKEHDRCGSPLVAPLLAANLAGAALLKHVAQRPSPAAAGALSLASMGAAVEVFAWAERHPETRAARALRLPGHEIQRLIGTREPSAAQLEVGHAALEEILRVEQA